MTKIKLCGLMRPEDIACANRLRPDHVGFVFWPKSKRYIEKESARRLKEALDPAIKAVGVFVEERVETVADIANSGTVDAVQLHGQEDEAYIRKLRDLTSAQIIKAFKIKTKDDVKAANGSTADLVLLDAGMGEGQTFDWDLIRDIGRPYILAGGLDCENVAEAITRLAPYAVDVSSGIESAGRKDPAKMNEFVSIVRNTDRNFEEEKS